jgi:hypothetical protein
MPDPALSAWFHARRSPHGGANKAAATQEMPIAPPPTDARRTAQHFAPDLVRDKVIFICGFKPLTLQFAMFLAPRSAHQGEGYD